ncbi:MAG: ATP-binding protein [Clostridiales Family XIII bacterium]|jgi:predicted AAA+ superfamily ATPase|nr:ATP-binding protein [Clostridiales Family XIII bacterium]
MYIKRHIEEVLKSAINEKGALCVTGARQVGKSTVLKTLFTEHRELTLDDGRLLKFASEQPEEFFAQFEPPVFVDEIQYAPSLFSYVKMYIDKTGAKGMFVLSGSQRYEMMSGMTESLAGRVNLIDLYGLSVREILGDDFREEFMPTLGYLKRRNPKPLNYNAVWENIWRGFFPEIVESGSDWSRFYSSYVRTYLDRDVSKLGQVGDLLRFEKFMVAMAARTGQLLNIADIAKDTGISRQTAEKWLSVLIASNIVYILKPYYNNVTKRLIKTPKIYFLDTGLASYLIGWDNVRVLQNGAMAGAVFETFVMGEIIKSWTNSNGVTPNMNFYFFRDKDGNEIDLLIKRNGILYPVEIKKHINYDKNDIAAFKLLDKIPDMKRGEGCVVCMAEDVFPITAMDRAVGVHYL